MTSATRRRFAELVRSEPVDVGLACLLVGAEVEPDLDVDASLAVLNDLAASVPLVPGASPAAAAAAMRVALSTFEGGSFEDVRSSLLHEVLRRRSGLPILLSVVWCEVAARLDVPAYCLGVPGHVLVGIGDPQDQHVVVDPYRGGARATAPEPFPAMAPHELLLRLLTNVRALTARQERSLETARTRLWAVELSLVLPRHPVALRRERGELLVRLGDHLGGAADLEEYASLVEPVDSDEASTALREAQLARARLN